MELEGQTNGTFEIMVYLAWVLAEPLQPTRWTLLHGLGVEAVSQCFATSHQSLSSIYPRAPRQSPNVNSG